MNYQKIYKDFIFDRRIKEVDMIASGVYVERHHIVPRSMGGSDDPENLIALTAGDHFFAHLCLAKAHGEKQWAAVWAMCGMSNRSRRNFDRSWAVSRKQWFKNLRMKNKTAFAESRNGRSDNKVYKWCNVQTKERLNCTRYELPVSNKQSIVDYLGGKTKFVERKWYVLGVQYLTHREAIDSFRNTSSKALVARATAAARKANLGAKNHRATRVRCVETDTIYETQRSAAKETGALQPKISECLKGSRKTAGGYHWEYVP
jgi:hypothetical protein